MSEFRGLPLQVVADRTSEAHRDFADWRISEERQDVIARTLKRVPVSKDDRTVGDVRLREMIEGFDVVFMLVQEPDAMVVRIIGFMRTGEFETHAKTLLRAGSELHPIPKAVATLLEGRKRR